MTKARLDRVQTVLFSNDRLIVTFSNGREISAPLAWLPLLVAASVEDRAQWEISAAGHGIHWPRIDEDLSIAGLLRGERAA